MKINKKQLVLQSVQGKIHHPLGGNYRISHEGKPRILPATGGISYNVSIGDPAFGYQGDHIEPGVSVRNEDKMENAAFTTLSCIGNEAKVVTGDAKGAKGYVTGIHGGIDHVMVAFESEDLENMAIDDKILVKAYGQGLKIQGFDDVDIMNIDPNLFELLDIEVEEDNLFVDVVCQVPAYLMGSGIGSPSAYTGDYDIMTADTELIKELGIDQLRFGDLVLLKDCDNTYGRGYLSGAVSIGVVIHSDCIKMGHGPGITTIMSSKKSIIQGHINKEANIGHYIKNIKRT